MTDRVCPYCATVLLTGCRMQCGADVCRRAHTANRQRDFQRRYRERTGTHYTYAMPSRPQRKSNTHCVDCSAPVKWGRTQETRCRECSRKNYRATKGAESRAAREAERARCNSRRSRALRKQVKAATGVLANPRWIFAAGQCHRCGGHFVCRVTNDLPRYCSQTCWKQEAKDRRRAREAGVDIEPGQRWRIYARDNYTCRLCGVKIERKATPTSGLDFTIDHIIPLARGGAHSPDNWQTAHRICNSHKRDLILEMTA